jgi:hypothetical protein
MNKKIVTQILNVKYNSVSVNIKNTGFTQLERNLDGWTKWHKDGLTRKRIDHYTLSNAMIIPQPSPPPPKTKPRSGFVYNIGSSSPRVVEELYTTAQQIWERLFGTTLRPVISKLFLKRAATDFMQPGQPFENAVEVISAIVLTDQTRVIHFHDLYRFLAMFGPRESVMAKISELLGCSNATGEWLFFEEKKQQMMAPNPISAQFDCNEHNRLNIVIRNCKIISVWNLPTVSHTEQYLIDMEGKTYQGWKDYFDKNPLCTRTQPSYEKFSFNVFS